MRHALALLVSGFAAIGEAAAPVLRVAGGLLTAVLALVAIAAWLGLVLAVVMAVFG